MQRFKSPGAAQKFLSTHAAVYNVFNNQRHLTTRQTYRTLRSEATSVWRENVQLRRKHPPRNRPKRGKPIEPQQRNDSPFAHLKALMNAN